MFTFSIHGDIGETPFNITIRGDISQTITQIITQTIGEVAYRTKSDKED